MSELPQAETADTDAVQVALQAAQALWSRGETTESLRWLKRAAESASDDGADLRSLQLAKAAAELRAKLFPSDAPPPPSPRATGLRELTGVRATPAFDSSPLHDAVNTPELGLPALGSPALGADLEGANPVARPEDAPPSSRSPSSAPQYVVHRPREAQRQLMGLSSSTLETAVQRNGTGYPSVPSWSAGSERRTSSPPPLPRAAFDDYEELDAEPDEESEDEADAEAGWSASAVATWRPTDNAQHGAAAREASTDAAVGQQREAASDSSPHLAPAGFSSSRTSSPPPLPELSAFGDDDGDPMRPEQPTVVLPQEEDAGVNAARPAAGGATNSYVDPVGGDESAWDSDPRMSNWDSGSAYGGWSGDPRGGSWAAAQSGGAVESPAALEATPPKLTARVHHQAVRVSFTPDARVPGQYVVRPLREGERPLGGERVALLVALEPGVPLV
ncbi:MAG TPA: hypothetical protein VJU61_26555 [Polyangiaceae bacterium]|nr:hypothetical protein [Polyangiaceae bacterium]